VWVDSWELNVGDSIVGRVQQAIQESSALLIVLSKSSVASEWCKKELNAGLMRELDEKRVHVLPVLVEDCEIPIFLREKLYADFRRKFDVGLKALVEAVAKVTSLDQGRIKAGNGNIDWSETWGYQDDAFCMEYTLMETSPDWPFTLLTEISLKCSEEATRRYREYEQHNLANSHHGVACSACGETANRHVDKRPSSRHREISPRGYRQYNLLRHLHPMQKDGRGLLETILTTRAFSSGESFRAVCATYSRIRFK
jgi:hypothetical protein